MTAKSKAARKPATEEEVKRGNMFHVPFSKLRLVEGLNIRHIYKGIDELAASIKENGVEQPVIGFRDIPNDLWFVVHGHRRYTACELIYKTTGVDTLVPFIREEKGMTDDQRVIDMIVTNTGEPLNPLELAEAVKRLLEMEPEKGKEAWNIKSIAKKLGFSPLYVNRLNLLNAAPQKFKNIVEKGKISPTLAIQIAGNGEIDKFLADLDAGKFHKEDDKGEEREPDKITNKDLKKPNSVKFFKKFAATAELEQMPAEKKEVFTMFKKLIGNKISTKEFSDYFYN